MLEFIYIIFIIIGYFTAYIVSLYSLAIFIDPDEVETLFPKVSDNRKKFITKLADDPRAFTQIAIVYKSFILIVVSVLAVNLLSSLSDIINSSLKISIPIGLLVVWLLYIFLVELLPRRASRHAITLNLLKRLWLIEIVYKLFLPVLNIYRSTLKKSGEQAHATEEEKPMRVRWKNIRVQDLGLNEAKPDVIDPYVSDWQVEGIGPGRFYLPGNALH